MSGYPFAEIEQRWRRRWEESKTFRTPDEPDPDKEKFYILDMFPYPSGTGLHVGHPEGYTATDILARYKRMKGFNVLHAIGWDAFGLPAEQYAVKTNTHPRVTTEANIARFREQLKMLGFSYDWDREIDTTSPDYFRWTQWIFLKLYEKGLAFQGEALVWWCPELGTTLANEEVVDGKSEVGGYECVRKPLRQWMLRITEYAERLLEGLDDLDWPESTKEMQRNWIGKSEGAEVDFPVCGVAGETIRVFTTRPDTLFGATYMVLAPEHPLIPKMTAPDRREEVEAYVAAAAKKSDRERSELQRDKTGVFTGGFALNPANGERIPVWVAEYVLISYGTGAIMAVPAHDERDHAFAQTFGLPIREVVSGGDVAKEAWTGDGLLVRSSSEDRAIPGVAERGVSIDGLRPEAARRKMIAWLEANECGRARIQYKLRDWLFSRQRYWGEPFPLIFVDGVPKPLPEDALPVTLPDLADFQPSGHPEGPLASAADWVRTVDPETGAPARRETNTMPQWAGSCWYFLRFIDPRNDRLPVDPEKERYWMPVDLYVGGAEHAVLHLLYARFWHKVLYDAGVVSTPEPFRRLVHQGMILGEIEYAVNGRRIAESDVRKEGDGFVLKDDAATPVEAHAYKMSKSRGNVINPEDVVRRYGADSLRLYEMFMGPLEQVKPWSMRGVEGVHRFLNRVWRLLIDEETGALRSGPDAAASKEEMRTLHRTIAKVTADVERLHFNTAIAAMMEFVNAANKWDAMSRETARAFVLLLSPFAPHIGEELWRKLGGERTLAYEPWPEVAQEYLQEETVAIAVQVNGRIRATIAAPRDAAREAVLQAARREGNVAKHIGERAVKREIYVPGRIVNFVL